MMKLLNFNIIHLTFFLILGIVIQHYLSLIHSWMLYCTLTCALLLGIASLRQLRPPTLIYFSLSAMTFMSIGALRLSFQAPEQQANHYLDFKDANPVELHLQLEKRLKPGFYHGKFYAKVVSVNEQAASGRLLINIDSSLNDTDFKIDDILIVKSNIQNIPKPLNPHQFDYAQYLNHHGVNGQVYVNAHQVLLLSSKRSSLYGFAEALRDNITINLERSGFSTTSIQMIKALLLGQKQDIDPELYNSYINAGTVHILAVSGLHVGIILWILTWLLKPLLYFKYGRLVRVITILILLWAFAIVAGLSPSITRAVSMFSLVSIAMHLKRQTNIYNTLITSAFILLLINPNLLFEVGFQLSYAAVLSIVSYQPIICGWWRPKTKIVNYIWQIFGVTLAAQLGIAPLSLLYFHQFPGLFFVSNLVIVPALGCILGFGLLVIVLSLMHMVPQFIVLAFEQLISLLNGFIAWIAHFESFLLQDIPFNRTQLVICYAFIIGLYGLFKTKSFRWATVSLLALISFQGHQLYRNTKESSKQFIVFNASRRTLIAQQHKQQLQLYHSTKDSVIRKHSFIKQYQVAEAINTVSYQDLQHVYQHKEALILLIDSTATYQGLSFQPDIIVLRDSPKLNLNRLIAQIEPKVIIADASNYKSYVRRWQQTCKTQNTTFYYTAKDGAFILCN